jgi:hypothetical protein
MYWVIAYCVLVATGFTYCVIHDHAAGRSGSEKRAATPAHLSVKHKS